MKVICKGYKFEKDKLKGNVNVEIEGVFKVNGIRVMDGQYGLWLAFPSRQVKNKEGKEEWIPYITFPKELQKAILNHMDKIDSTWTFNWNGAESMDGSPADSSDEFPF